MKKPLLITTTLFVLALSATSIYAQVTTGTSIVDKMKAAAHSFTLSSVLNPTDTGLQSSPIKGKKTGDILTAGEWNRVLELVSEGGGSSVSSSSSGWVDVSINDVTDFDMSCEYRAYVPKNAQQTDNSWQYFIAVTPKRLRSAPSNDSEVYIPSNDKKAFYITPNGRADAWGLLVTKMEKRCVAGGATSAVGTIVEGGIIKTSAKTISNWDLITLEGSWNSGGGDAAPTGGYIYKLGGQVKLAYVEASGISKDIVLTTTAQNVHNLTVKLSGDDVVIDPSSTNTLAYLVWKLGGGSTSSGWVDVPLAGSDPFDKTCEYRFYLNAMGVDAVYYAGAVAPNQIVYVSHSSVTSSIPASNKSSYQVNGTPSYNVNKIEKRCN